MSKIQGNRITLREKCLADAPDDYAWRTDKELALLDAAVPLRISYTQFQRHYAADLDVQDPWSQRFAIDIPGGTHIGNCMYYNVDNVRGQAEVGIMIGDRRYWNRGYGTEAITTLVEHAFSTLSVTKLYLHTLEWNKRAQRSFTKSGFQPVGRIKRYGETFIRMEQSRATWQTSPNYGGAQNALDSESSEGLSVSTQAGWYSSFGHADKAPS